MDFLQETKELDFYVLNTKAPRSDEVDLVEACFQLWKKTWEKTFNKLKVDYGERIHSDDFLSRELLALVYKRKPVGLFFRSIFTNTDSQISHSYFKNYPKEFLTYLSQSKISKFTVLSYMTIDSEWKKNQTDVSISEILFSLAILRFKESGEKDLIGYIRKDMGSFHEVFDRHGGRVIYEDNAYNVPVAFMHTDRSNACVSSIKKVSEVSEKLWEKRLLNNNLKLKREAQYGLY